MKQKAKMKRIAGFIGNTANFMGFLVLFITFMWIYFGVGYEGIISINDYGEANLEFVLLIALLSFAFYSWVRGVIDI